MPQIRRGATALLLALAVAATGACGSDATTATPTPTFTASGTPTDVATGGASAAGRVEPVVSGTRASGLQAPWSSVVLPDGSALVSERDKGEVMRVLPDGSVESVGTVPGVKSGGEGGLLGLALHPDFANQPWVYAYFTGTADNRIVRMKYAKEHLGALEIVLSGLQKGSNHNGGRIAFGPDGFLYVGTGDAGDTSLSQDLSSSNGKILRLTDRGEPAPGNPSPTSPIYSYGHRNVQGLAWDSNGDLWASEFGQNTWDELNRITAGGNYGWPVVEGRSDDDRFIDPQVQWRTDEASPSGIAIVRDNVLMASLRGERLWVVPIKRGTAGKPRDYFSGEYGRLRAIDVASDGTALLLTNNTDGRGAPREGDDKALKLTF